METQTLGINPFKESVVFVVTLLIGLLVGILTVFNFKLLLGILVILSVLAIMVPFLSESERFLTFLLFLCILGISVHTFVIKVLDVDVGIREVANTIISSWKEILIVILLLISLLRNKEKILAGFRFTTPDIFLSIFILIVFLYSLTSPSITLGLYGFRGTVLPLLIYFTFRNWRLSYEKQNILAKILIGMSTAIALFAIYQALFLGADFYIKYGFAEDDGSFLQGFRAYGIDWIRVPATFIGPNSAGFYFTCQLILARWYMQISPRPFTKHLLAVSIGIMMIAMLFTLSRTAWLMTALGFTCLAALSGNIQLTKKIVLLSASILGICCVYVFASNSSLLQMISSRIQLTDPSAMGRMPDLIKGISIIQENPFGVGVGMVGSRAGRYSQELVGLFHTENFFLQVFMELGIVGGLIHLGTYLAAIGFLLKAYYTGSNLLTVQVFSPLVVSIILISITIGSLILPNLNDLSVSGHLWMLVGIAVGNQRTSMKSTTPDCPSLT